MNRKQWVLAHWRTCSERRSHQLEETGKGFTASGNSSFSEMSVDLSCFYRMQHQVVGLLYNQQGSLENDIGVVLFARWNNDMESFVNNRLPYLTFLKTFIALQQGKIVILRLKRSLKVKNEEQRRDILKEAIAQDYLLAQQRAC